MKKTRIEKLLEKFPFVTHDLLYRCYIVEEKSLPDIYHEHGIDFKACSDLLRHYGIPMRTISQSRMTPYARQRIAKSIRAKYGVDNPSQLEWVKEKKKATFLKHYGVDNIWKSPEYYKWLEDYMLIHHGVKRVSTNPWGWRGAGKKRREERIQKLFSGRDKWWASLSDEEKYSKMSELCRANTFCSKLETRVADALSRLHIVHRRHVPVGHRNYDFEIDKTKILIEVNGDFWHANPEKYKAGDVVHFPDGHRKVEEIWKNDERKRLTAEAKGYKLLIIWESELNKTSDLLLEKWLVAKIIV